MVGQEDLLEAHGRLFVVEKRVALKVVFKASEVYVCRPACGERVVAHEQFAVHEPRSVHVNLHSRLDHVAQIRPPRPLYKPAVAVPRDDDAYVDASHRGRLQGEEHGLRGQEVGRLDVYVAPCAEDYSHISLHDVGVGGYRAACNYLRDTGRCHAAIGLGVVFPA